MSRVCEDGDCHSLAIGVVQCKHMLSTDGEPARLDVANSHLISAQTVLLLFLLQNGTQMENFIAVNQNIMVWESSQVEWNEAYLLVLVPGYAVGGEYEPVVSGASFDEGDGHAQPALADHLVDSPPVGPFLSL